MPSLVLALVLIWITRKVISRIQDRIGPNRLGPFGLFQTIADALKLLSKEDINPTYGRHDRLSDCADPFCRSRASWRWR